MPPKKLSCRKNQWGNRVNDGIRYYVDQENPPLSETEPVKRKRGRQKNSFNRIGPNNTFERDPFKPLSPRKIAKLLSTVTGFTQPECLLMYDALCAILYCELLHGRGVHFPQVCKLEPQIVKGARLYQNGDGTVKYYKYMSRMRCSQDTRLKNDILKMPSELMELRLAEQCRRPRHIKKLKKIADKEARARAREEEIAKAEAEGEFY